MSEELLSVAVPAHLAAALREAVATGEYPSLDAALANALESWSKRHEDREDAIAELKAMIGASIHDPRPGLTLAEVDAQLEAFFQNVEAPRSDEAA